MMKAHANDGFAARFGEPNFRIRSVKEMDGKSTTDLIPTCSYCGSITIDDCLNALETPGTTYSGSDWKYGYPHKFYIDIPCEPFTRCVSGTYRGGQLEPGSLQYAEQTKRHHKFYSEHMRDATPEQIERWNRVARPRLGISFSLSAEGKLVYSAPHAGFQTWGTIGA